MANGTNALFGLGLLPGLAGRYPEQTNGFLSGLKNFFVGQPSGIQQVNRFNSDQQDALNKILRQSISGLQDPTMGFAPIENQARSSFYQNTVPSLAERFTSMGGQGSAALSSPSFASLLGQAGSGLETNLASLKAQYGQTNQDNLMRLLSMGLTPQFNSYATEGQQGLLQQLIPAAARAGTAYLSGGGSEIMNLLGLLSHR